MVGHFGDQYRPAVLEIDPMPNQSMNNGASATRGRL
jgi:hypothetical protein